jgi:peptidyl-prolyl cis-trans isomerase SurA
LRTLIERRLILDAYEKHGGTLPDWVVDQRIEEVVRDMFNDDRGALMKALARDSLTYSEWRKGIQDHIVASMMRGANIEQNVTVSPGALREYYKANQEKYRRAAKLNLRVIVFSKGKSADEALAKRKQAEKAIARLKAGEDFAGLARELSDGAKASEGGAWGWEEPRMLRPEIAKAAQPLRAGQTSGIVETDDELYIIKVERRQEEGVIPFAEVQPKIERQLRRERAEELYDAWIGRLKQRAYIKVFDVGLF